MRSRSGDSKSQAEKANGYAYNCSKSIGSDDCVAHRARVPDCYSEMRQTSPRAIALVFLATAALAGCQSDKTGECPTMSALVPTSEETVFQAPNNTDPSNQLYQVEITRVDGNCDLDKKLTSADVSLAVHFRATRAPSGAAAEYKVPYFVAVTEGTDRVIAKKQFEVMFAFAPGQTS